VKKQSLAVTVLIETDDPRLDNPATNTPADVAALRVAILEHLPKLTRVVSVMPEELAVLMHRAHALAIAGAAQEVGMSEADIIDVLSDEAPKRRH
jgi:hypothetical protein